MMKTNANKELRSMAGNPLFFPVTGLVIFLLTGSVFFITLRTGEYNGALAALIIVWGYCLLYGLADLSARFNFAVMTAMIFVFLLSRPVIACLYGQDWCYWSDSTICRSMTIILLGQIALFCGAFYIEGLAGGSEIKHTAGTLRNEAEIVRGLRFALAAVLLFTWTGCMAAQMYSYLSLRNYSYAAMYTGLAPSVPFVFSLLSTIFPYVVFAYLATMPGKKASLIVMSAYILTGVPVFLLGNRTSLISKIVFCTVYFFIRNKLRVNTGRWITPAIKMAFIIMVAASVLFLGVMNYSRADKVASLETSMPIGVDFFYRQGTTFDTLCQGLEHQDRLESLPQAVSYTFGDLIDYVKHNRLSRYLFGADDIGTKNSIKIVEESNSLAHRLSYVCLGEAYYLEGHGRGSVYLLENYLDFGYPGVIWFNFLLGMLMSGTVAMMKRGRFLLNLILLTVLSKVFLIARSSSSSFLLFLVTPHSWIVVLGVLLASRLCVRLRSPSEDKSAVMLRTGRRRNVIGGETDRELFVKDNR